MDVGEGSGRPRNFPSASQSQENNIVCLASTDCKRQSAGMRSKTEKGSASFDGFFRFRNIPIPEDTSESLDDVVLTDSGGRFRSAIPLQSGHEWPPLPLMKEETKKKTVQFCESSPGPLLFHSGDSDLLVLQVSAHSGSTASKEGINCR